MITTKPSRKGRVDTTSVEPKLARVAEVCAYLGVSRPTVYRLKEAGCLDAVRIGHSLRFTWDSVRRVATEGADLG